MKQLDLYKVIILLSLVLLPAVGYWAYSMDQEIAAGKEALEDARKARGDLEEIGKFQKAIEEQRANRDRRGGLESYDLYFQRQIQTTAPRLKNINFEIRPPADSTIRKRQGGRGRGQTINAIDSVVNIIFKAEPGSKDRLRLTRGELLPILFNCESQSKIWKLRELSIHNASEGLGRGGRGKAPPPELEDWWEVKTLKFVSRKPVRT